MSPLAFTNQTIAIATRPFLSEMPVKNDLTTLYHSNGFVNRMSGVQSLTFTILSLISSILYFYQTLPKLHKQLS